MDGAYEMPTPSIEGEGIDGALLRSGHEAGVGAEKRQKKEPQPRASKLNASSTDEVIPEAPSPEVLATNRTNSPILHLEGVDRSAIANVPRSPRLQAIHREFLKAAIGPIYSDFDPDAL